MEFEVALFPPGACGYSATREQAMADFKTQWLTFWRNYSAASWIFYRPPVADDPTVPTVTTVGSRSRVTLRLFLG